MKFMLTVVLALLLVAGTSNAQDADGDGVVDAQDNCSTTPNSAQIDSNFDGFGNACDADLWNDGLVEEVDFEIWLKAFGSTLGDPNYNPDADLTGDNVVGIPDFSVLAMQTGGPPGPSGLACANVTAPNIPCAATLPDTDGDGVGDLADNCVAVANASQDDSNLDGIGTACDPDYDNDGNVDDVDFEVFLNAFASMLGDPNFNPDADHTGDGVIGIPDFAILSGLHGGPPGPNGAGTAVGRSISSTLLCDAVGCP